ncbi:MAG: hypothetical protein QF732_04545 [Nitrospinaceae bacterium]|nr:hypothetical protein [Nitrospinaceae bacterium]
MQIPWQPFPHPEAALSLVRAAFVPTGGDLLDAPAHAVTFNQQFNAIDEAGGRLDLYDIHNTP